MSRRASRLPTSRRGSRTSGFDLGDLLREAGGDERLALSRPGMIERACAHDRRRRLRPRDHLLRQLADAVRDPTVRADRLRRSAFESTAGRPARTRRRRPCSRDARAGRLRAGGACRARSPAARGPAFFQDSATCGKPGKVKDRRSGWSSRERRARPRRDRADPPRPPDSAIAVDVDSAVRWPWRHAATAASRCQEPLDQVAAREAGRAGHERQAAAIGSSRERRAVLCCRSRRGTPGSASLIGRHHHSFCAVPLDRLAPAPPRTSTCGAQPRPLQLDGVERVAAIVPLPVGDVADQGFGLARQLEDATREIDVAHVVAAADVVDLAVHARRRSAGRPRGNGHRRAASRARSARRRRAAPGCRRSALVTNSGMTFSGNW